MRSPTFIGLTIMLIGTTISTFLVHWFVVCPLLRKDGSRFPTGLLPWRMFRELSRYRDVLRARSSSLSPYYIILLLRWFNLLLAFVVGMWWLMQYNAPPS
jgi:hypothetical protein